MSVEKINIPTHKLRILIAPLDWGLGHATRIIPLVKILEEAGAQVVLAANGAVGKLLQTELPDREILPLSGYNIQYGKTSKTFFFKLLLQVPRIIAIVKKEQQWLKSTIAEKRIDAVISDNRFGFFANGTPSVYITHQLLIETGYGSFFNRIAQKIHYKYIKKFSECWVPDTEKNGLAGKLSHPAKLPVIPVKYIGPLSRFGKAVESVEENKLLILLSGPEPQRTIWENKLLDQLKKHEGNTVLVRGLPLNVTNELKNSSSLKVYNYLSSKDLAKEINDASMVICRSGYSTIMDLAALEKKAIIVPTPGQGEQEYLATYLMQHNRFYSCSQDTFELNNALEKLSQFSFDIQALKNEGVKKKAIEDWLKQLKKIKALQ